MTPHIARFRWLLPAICLCLAIAAFASRLYRLDEIPVGIHYDETAHGMDALSVLQGEHAPFFTRNYGREGMIVYAIALTTTLFGSSVLALRLPTALVSAATVFAVLWLGQILFGRNQDGQVTPWRGLVVGGIAAGLLAVSADQVVAGRIAYRAPFMSLLLCLSLGLLWEGGRRQSWQRVALAGVCAGLLAYTYIAARFAAVLFPLFGLSFLLPFRSVSRAEVRAALPLATVFVVAAGLVAAPILVHFALNPDHFFMRSKMVWVFGSELNLVEAWGALLNNLWRHRHAFDLQGGHLKPWESLFFWLGVGVAVHRWKRGAAFRLLLLWLVVMLLPSIVSGTGGPNYLRMIGAVPAVSLLAGLGMWEAFRFAQRRLPLRMASHGALAAGLAVTGLIAVQGATAYNEYFKRWETVVPSELPWYLGMPWLELAKTLDAQPTEPGTVYLAPAFRQKIWDIDYLFSGSAPVRYFHPGEHQLAQQVRAALTAEGDVSIVKVVEWDLSVSAWMGKDSGQFALLLGKYGRYQGSEDHALFRIHSYSDIVLDRPWRFYEHLEPLAVDYDGGIALQGLALGQGPEQMATGKKWVLGQDRPGWLALRWQTTPGLNVDYSLSLRLYDAAGGLAFQEDDVLRNSVHQPTSSWAEESVDTLHLIELPPGLPAGEYELRLVVYDFETLVPTVEIGTWRPEISLTRLRLAGAEPQEVLSSLPAEQNWIEAIAGAGCKRVEQSASSVGTGRLLVGKPGGRMAAV